MIGLDLLLIPRFGASGAAGAMVGGELFINIAAAIGVTRNLGRIPVRMNLIARGVVAVLAMMAAMVAARTFLGLIPEIAAGISVYLLAGWAVGLRAALRATPV